MNAPMKMLLAIALASCAGAVRAATTVDGVLSENDTVLTVTVDSGEADLGTKYLSNLTGNTVVSLVKAGEGTLVVPASVDLSAYTGTIRVKAGVYRILAATGAGSVAAGAGDLTVEDKAAFEIAPASTVMDLRSKRIVFEGAGPDGAGALRSAATKAQDGAWVFGTNLVMTGNAVIGSTTTYQLSLGAVNSTPWCLDMGGFDLELRPYSGAGGKNAQNIRLMGKTTISNPGNITVNQGNLIIRECPADASLGGTSACSLTMGSSDNGATMLQFSKSKLFTPWTLVWNTTRNLDIPSTDLSVTTNQNFWAGPVNLQSDMNVNFGTYNFFQRASFWSKVSGVGGFRLNGAYDTQTSAYTDGELTLLSDENNFAGGVTATHAKLRLAKSGALPSAGGDFIGSDATLTLEGTSAYVLPGAAFSGDSTVSGGNGRWTKPVVKTGTGTLTLATAVGGTELDLQGGKVFFSIGRDGRIAGLISGCRVYSTTAEALTAYESDEIVTNVVELTPTAAYSTSHSYWSKANSLITYTGYLWSNATTNETWSFVTALGRKAKLIVNDVTVFEHEYVTGDAATTKMTCGHANTTIRPGANRFELRIHTSASSQGPSCRSTADNPMWIKSNFGFCLDRLGRDSAGEGGYAFQKYTAISDEGDAQSMTWFAAGNDATCVHPETGTTIDLVPRFDRISFSNGAKLDCASLTAYSTATLGGFANLTNCGTFGVTSSWTVRTSELGVRVAETDGAFDFSSAVLTVDEDGEKVALKTPFTIATAAGGIVGLPTLAAGTEGWEVSLSSDGKSVILTRVGKGLMLLFR